MAMMMITTTTLATDSLHCASGTILSNFCVVSFNSNKKQNEVHTIILPK
jgi:hypothetical protein